MLKSIRKSSEVDRPVERQADTLGSLILMPGGQVKMGFYRNRSDADPANALSKVFGVSTPAMEIRLKELRLI
jgi:Zn-dependent peptidase ImmA (M78 family)